MLTDHQMQLLRDKLNAELKELIEVEEEAESAVETVELDQTKVGRLSRMEAMQAQAVSIESNRLRVMHIHQVNEALRRMDEDEYGFCLDCGEDINPKRLEFDPAASLCISCAEKEENRERRQHGYSD